MGSQIFRPLLVTRTQCRICGSQALTPVADLGPQFISSLFGGPGGDPPIKRRIPLELVRCDPSHDQNACGLVQMLHTVPPRVLYHRYFYQSGINQSMRGHLASVAALAEQFIPLHAGEIILDIGCNDGTLLSSYSTPGLRLLGIDPSDVALMAREKGLCVVNDFFSTQAFRSVYSEDKARVITSIAMFYDLEDPHAFVADIAACLRDDGIWILEQSYLPSMLQRNSFDTICHEHLEYYSLATLERLFGEHGLEVLDVRLNDVNGGSFQLVVGHAGKHPRHPERAKRVQDLRISEFELALDTDEPFARFRKNIETIRRDLKEFLTQARKEGKLVHGYGASTKGNTTLQFCDLTPDLLPAIADRNPRKWGTKTIGTNIPIISEEDSRAAAPDYYLVLPWHFLEEFKERESAFLARGGRFVICMPQVHLVGP